MEIHEARRGREAAAVPPRSEPAVPQPMGSLSPELEELMKTIVLEGRVEREMQDLTLDEAISQPAGDAFEPDALLPGVDISPPGTRPGDDGSELGAAALSLSSWADEMDASETSSRAGEAEEVSVPAVAAKRREEPASFEGLEEVHKVIWARSRAALELMHRELADGLLLELRSISMKYLDMHKASLSPEQERWD